MNQSSMLNKVPAVTLAFWAIKIAATTLGETGGDAVSMSLGLGYATSTLIFFGFLVVVLSGQILSKVFHPFLYWAVILATTTVGTTLSDYLDRTVGLGYPRSSALLFSAVLISLAIWRFTTGSVSVSQITTRRAELFYWATILLSNTLGTALGDFMSTTTAFGFDGGALFFGSLLAVIAALYFFSSVSHTILFWAAFILTRPLGATVGDLLTKPVADGGLNLSRITSSLVLAALMALCIVLTESRSEGNIARGQKAS